MLQHSRSPGCNGCLLYGLLAATATGVPAAGRRQLSGHTSAVWQELLNLNLYFRCFFCSQRFEETGHCSQKRGDLPRTQP